MLTSCCQNLAVSNNNCVGAGAEVSHVFARSTLVPGAGLMLPDTGPNPIVNGTAKSSPKKSQYLPIEQGQSKLSQKRMYFITLVVTEIQHHFDI
jgi:hypothetical protein